MVRPSPFSPATLIEGLRDGAADSDLDGDITVDELYEYVYQKVSEERPQQRPKKHASVSGKTVVAQNVNWSLPEDLNNYLHAPYADFRLQALHYLDTHFRKGNPAVRSKISQTVEALRDNDDSLTVRGAASIWLQEHPIGGARVESTSSTNQAETAVSPQKYEREVPPFNAGQGDSADQSPREYQPMIGSTVATDDESATDGCHEPGAHTVHTAPSLASLSLESSEHLLVAPGRGSAYFGSAAFYCSRTTGFRGFLPAHMGAMIDRMKSAWRGQQCRWFDKRLAAITLRGPLPHWRKDAELSNHTDGTHVGRRRGGVVADACLDATDRGDVHLSGRLLRMRDGAQVKLWIVSKSAGLQL